jgi:hypothetical protein
VTKIPGSANKSAFVRQFPDSMPAPEVVRRAQSAGFSLSTNHVYNVRARAKPRATPPGEARSEPRPGSKKAFVLGFADDVRAAIVVEAAARAGFAVGTAYVHWARSDQRRAQRKASSGVEASIATRATTPTHGTRAAAPAPPLGAAIATAEHVLIETALRHVGLDRALDILRLAYERLGRLTDD